jgi:hypothetical protein
MYGDLQGIAGRGFQENRRIRDAPPQLTYCERNFGMKLAFATGWHRLAAEYGDA